MAKAMDQWLKDNDAELPQPGSGSAVKKEPRKEKRATKKKQRAKRDED
jgi:hypothetical protein